ncbi:hypothetical protein ACFLTG_03985 [Chloroflexota bacterium]
MSFIRTKEIPPWSGNWYDYEVETIHKGKQWNTESGHPCPVDKAAQQALSHLLPKRQTS